MVTEKRPLYCGYCGMALIESTTTFPNQGYDIYTGGRNAEVKYYYLQCPKFETYFHDRWYYYTLDKKEYWSKT
jgi:hypothetical protein